MASFSEIEKLERRYQENPRGLTFAPLAEYYRKSGDIARALELVRQGLEHHPDYIPASIVLGRCHLDLYEDAEAEAAFTHVLALDPENVIALKALADVAERRGALDDAERWLTTLLSVDRSNEEAREQLARVSTAPRPNLGGVTLPGAEAAEAAEAAAGVAGVAATPEGPEAPRASAEPVLEAPVEPETDSGAPPTFAAAVERAMSSHSGEFPAVGPLAEQVEEEPAAPGEGADELGELAAQEPGSAELEPLELETTAEAPTFAWPTAEEEADVTGRAPADEAALEAAEPSLVLDELAPPPEGVEPAAGLVVEEPEAVDGPVAALDGLVGSGFDVEPAPSILDEPSPVGAEPGELEIEPLQGADQSLGLGIEQHDEIVLEASAEPLYPTEDVAGELGAGTGETGDEERDDPFGLERSASAPVLGEAPEAEAAADAEAMEPAEPTEGTVVEPRASEPAFEAEAAPAAEPVPVDEEAEVDPEALRSVAAAFEAQPEPAWPAAVPPLATPAGVEPEPDAAAAGELPAMPVVLTESMAELYLAQGHRDQALLVLRAIAARRPEDAALAARIAELEAAVAGAAEAPEEIPAAVPAGRPAYAAAETGGESVAELFRSLLSARLAAAPAPPASPVAGGSAAATEAVVEAPPAAPAGETRRAEESRAGAPTRPASDHLSLSSVFGEEPAAPSPAAGSSVSFDDFFNVPAPEAADATRTVRPSRPVEAPEDDLDQFNAWLQNLKR